MRKPFTSIRCSKKIGTIIGLAHAEQTHRRYGGGGFIHTRKQIIGDVGKRRAIDKQVIKIGNLTNVKRIETLDGN